MKPNPHQTEMPCRKDFWNPEALVSLQQSPISWSEEEQSSADDNELCLQFSENGKAMRLRDKNERILALMSQKGQMDAQIFEAG